MAHPSPTCFKKANTSLKRPVCPVPRSYLCSHIDYLSYLHFQSIAFAFLRTPAGYYNRVWLRLLRRNQFREPAKSSERVQATPIPHYFHHSVEALPRLPLVLASRKRSLVVSSWLPSKPDLKSFIRRHLCHPRDPFRLRFRFQQLPSACWAFTQCLQAWSGYLNQRFSESASGWYEYIRSSDLITNNNVAPGTLVIVSRP